MRPSHNSRRLTFALALLLALILAPAAGVRASVEQAREQGSTATAPAKPSETTANGEDDEDADAEAAKAEVCPPTFNTVEDIHAHVGPASALLETRPVAQPDLVWLPVAPVGDDESDARPTEEQPAPRSAPLSSTKAR